MSEKDVLGKYLGEIEGMVTEGIDITGVLNANRGKHVRGDVAVIGPELMGVRTGILDAVFDCAREAWD